MAICTRQLSRHRDPWVFKGSLDDVGEAVVPHELHNVTLWMPKWVQTVKTEDKIR